MVSKNYPLFISLIRSTVWLIEARRAEAMLAGLMLRLENGARSAPYLSDDDRLRRIEAAKPTTVPMVTKGNAPAQSLTVLRLIGTIFPRGNLDDISGGGISLANFQSEFQQAASDPNVGAILLEIDSPGGAVDAVPETAAMIAAAVKARPDRPVVAIANTVAGSAAYWIASAASELVVAPSGMVGSIGVYMLHLDETELAATMGVNPTYIFEGARKVEGHPFAPLDDVALAAMQADVKHFYDLFVADVARGRHVSQAVVRRDPVAATAAHFGGGRSYGATVAVAMGLADRVATLQDVVQGLVHGGGGKTKGKAAHRLAHARRRLALTGRPVDGLH